MSASVGEAESEVLALTTDPANDDDPAWATSSDTCSSASRSAAAKSTGATPQAFVPTCTFVSGERGDMIKVDLSSTGGHNFVIDPFTFTGGAMALDNGSVISSGGPVEATGVFYVAPTINGSATGTEDAYGAAEVTGRFTAQFLGMNGLERHERSLRINVSSGYSTMGEGAVTEGLDALSVYRQQQRLKYLGFRGENAERLAVDGRVGTDTKFAFSTVNAAVAGGAVLTSQSLSPRSVEFLNATNAPRWHRYPPIAHTIEKTNGEAWGVSWAFDVLRAAAESSTRTLTVSAISPERARPNQHTEHRYGMDIDIEVDGASDDAYADCPTPSPEQCSSSFYATVAAPDDDYISAGNGNIVILNSASGPTSCTAGQPTNTARDARNNDTNYNNPAFLWAIADCIVYRYDHSGVRKDIDRFLNLAPNDQQARVGVVYFNDPRLWDGCNPRPAPANCWTTGRVQPRSGHGGHFHVSVLAPSTPAAPPGSAVRAAPEATEQSATTGFGTAPRLPCPTDRAPRAQVGNEGKETGALARVHCPRLGR